MKNYIIFFLVFFPMLAFSQTGAGGQLQSVTGLAPAPDSNYFIVTRLYRGRKGQPLYVPLDTIVRILTTTGGMTGGSGGNNRALIDTLPIGDVVINANGNNFQVNNAGSLVFSGDGQVGLSKTGTTGFLSISAPDDLISVSGERTEVKGDTIVVFQVGLNAELTIKDDQIFFENFGSDPAPPLFLGWTGAPQNEVLAGSRVGQFAARTPGTGTIEVLDTILQDLKNEQADFNGVYSGSGTVPLSGSWVENQGPGFSFGTEMTGISLPFTYNYTGIIDTTVDETEIRIGIGKVLGTYNGFDSFYPLLVRKTNTGDPIGDFAGLLINPSTVGAMAISSATNEGANDSGIGTYPQADSLLTILWSNNRIITNNSYSLAGYTTIPNARPGVNSIWRHNVDGSGQYIPVSSFSGLYSGSGNIPAGTNATVTNGLDISTSNGTGIVWSGENLNVTNTGTILNIGSEGNIIIDAYAGGDVTIGGGQILLTDEAPGASVTAYATISGTNGLLQSRVKHYAKMNSKGATGTLSASDTLYNNVLPGSENYQYYTSGFTTDTVKECFETTQAFDLLKVTIVGTVNGPATGAVKFSVALNGVVDATSEQTIQTPDLTNFTVVALLQSVSSGSDIQLFMSSTTSTSTISFTNVSFELEEIF